MEEFCSKGRKKNMNEFSELNFIILWLFIPCMMLNKFDRANKYFIENKC